jgi:hypothetical protein
MRLVKLFAFILFVLCLIGLFLEIFVSDKKSVAYIIGAIGGAIIFLTYALKKTE